MTALPRPSQIQDFRRHAMPFTGCLQRAEVEIAAAVFVLACLARGDRWQPLHPRQIGETLIELLKSDDCPSWISIGSIGIEPDFLGLVAGGWFQLHPGTADEDGAIEPLPAFFAAIDRYVVPGGVG